jgi:hypothetical protein
VAWRAVHPWEKQNGARREVDVARYAHYIPRSSLRFINGNI